MTPEEIDTRLRWLYGDVDWSTANGIVHVAAIEGRSRIAIIPGQHAPVSETDRFVLGAARARADAIVTTGAILRSEPDLKHDPSADEDENRAFLEWRRTRLGRMASPMLVVLTASGDLPRAHPALLSAQRGIIWTTTQGASRLDAMRRRPSGPDLGSLEILVRDRAQGEGIRAALRETLETLGAKTVLVEAGPSASKPLYKLPADSELPVRCDELLLSAFAGTLAPEAKGPHFHSEQSVVEILGEASVETRVAEESGEWIFRRYRR